MFNLLSFSKEQNGVVSGLALDIDQIAHVGALKNDIYTIAVPPVSLDNVYPKVNYSLTNDIIESSGCLLSELAIGINRGAQKFC